MERSLSERFERGAVILAVIAPLLGTFYAIYMLWERAVNWTDISLMVSLYVLTALGITIGYHRMLTHRAFEAHPVIRFIFLALGSMAVQGPAAAWASVHIQHHAETDTEHDPHSPVEGFFHAHLGWILFVGMKPNYEQYGKWLKKDPMIQFFSRTFVFWVALGYVIPYLIGGWQGVLWGGLVRTFLNNHVTWSVNSVCHTFGRRMFQTDDLSRNNWIVGLLAMGEGWHNNHHAFPRSAFHGMRWWQFDMSSYIIRFLEMVGLAKNVQRVSAERMEKRLVRKDGTAPVGVIDPEPLA